MFSCWRDIGICVSPVTYGVKGKEGSFLLCMCLAVFTNNLRTNTGSYFATGIISAVEILRMPKGLDDWYARIVDRGRTYGYVALGEINFSISTS